MHYTNNPKNKQLALFIICFLFFPSDVKTISPLIICFDWHSFDILERSKRFCIRISVCIIFHRRIVV